MKVSDRLLFGLFFLLAAFSFDRALTLEAAEVKIGILAQRGPEITLKRWNHLATYLRQAIPEHDFVIVPLNFADISQTVADKQVDFLFVNSGLLRAEDLIARHGGDEFLSLLIHVKDVEAVKSIARRVVDTLCLPMEIAGKKIAVGASIGIAVFPGDGTILEELIQKADKAMYVVKRSGKGTYRFFQQIAGEK